MNSSVFEEDSQRIRAKEKHYFRRSTWIINMDNSRWAMRWR